MSKTLANEEEGESFEFGLIFQRDDMQILGR
jgi:hypothetical protein